MTSAAACVVALRPFVWSNKSSGLWRIARGRKLAPLNASCAYLISILAPLMPSQSPQKTHRRRSQLLVTFPGAHCGLWTVFKPRPTPPTLGSEVTLGAATYGAE